MTAADLTLTLAGTGAAVGCQRTTGVILRRKQLPPAVERVASPPVFVCVCVSLSEGGREGERQTHRRRAVSRSGTVSVRGLGFWAGQGAMWPLSSGFFNRLKWRSAAEDIGSDETRQELLQETPDITGEAEYRYGTAFVARSVSLILLSLSQFFQHLNSTVNIRSAPPKLSSNPVTGFGLNSLLRK